MNQILILNGPNLNFLGVREPEIYGTDTLATIEEMCREKAEQLGFEIDFRQSNHEGNLVDWIQEAHTHFDGLVLNAAAYTHTSIAIHDALKLLDIPVIEVHLSNLAKREAFRQITLTAGVVTGQVSGLGKYGYRIGLIGLADLINGGH